MGFARAQPAACLADDPAAAAARLSARLAARLSARLAARVAPGPLLAYALPLAALGKGVPNRFGIDVPWRAV